MEGREAPFIRHPDGQGDESGDQLQHGHHDQLGEADSETEIIVDGQAFRYLEAAEQCMQPVLDSEPENQDCRTEKHISPDPALHEIAVDEEAALQQIDAGIDQDDAGIEYERPPGEYEMPQEIGQRRGQHEQRQQDADEYGKPFA